MHDSFDGVREPLLSYVHLCVIWDTAPYWKVTGENNPEVGHLTANILYGLRRAMNPEPQSACDGLPSFGHFRSSFICIKGAVPIAMRAYASSEHVQAVGLRLYS